MERQDYIDELLVKSLLDEADDAQKQYIANWRLRSPDNERYYGHFVELWQQSHLLYQQSTIDVDTAWSRFQQRIAAQQSVPARKIPLWKHTAFRVAATLLILIGASVGLGYWWGQPLTLDSGSQVLALQLPDGSRVTLNKHSQIRYPRHFASDKRYVELTGEAFFSVTPDKAHPFIISSNDVSVKVVGTSFNVKSRLRQTEVIVETGLVEVARNNSSIQLAPHERATVSAISSTPVKTTSGDKLYNYYRTNEFICEGTPLSRLVSLLSEVYEVQISIADPQKAGMPITATFRNENLDDLLAVVSETLNLTVERNGSVIILH